MDFEALKNSLGENLISLITWGGSINPYLGAAIALAGTIALIYLGYKAGKQAFQKLKKRAGETISDTGKEQDVADEVQDGVNSFLDGD